MAWDGSGNFTRSNGTQSGAATWADADAAGNNITTTQHDTHDEDLADGISACLTKNNEAKPTAHFAPNANGSYDLGTLLLKWRDAFFSRKVSVGSVGNSPTIELNGSTSGTATFSLDATATTVSLDKEMSIGSNRLTAGQIKFPATQVPSADANTLDDYEEGTWTPILGDGSGTISYTVQRGRFTKIGRLIFVQGEITINTISVAPTNNATIMNGLPFAVAATNYYRCEIFTSGMDWGAGATQVSGYFAVGASFVGINGITNNAAYSDRTCSDVSSGDILIATGFYNV